jgi:hypothetical protein
MTPLSVATEGYLHQPLGIATQGYITIDGVVETPVLGEVNYEPIGRRSRIKRQREEEDALAFVAAFMEMIE